MLDTMRAGDFNREALEARVRDAYFIPEGTSLTVQLLNFQKENRRIGLVVDEYGDILGLLTLEDILEEIVGEFANDKSEGMEEIQPQPDGSYLVAGSTQVRTLNRTLDWPPADLSVTAPKTLNGLVLEHLESFPSAGSVIRLHDHQLEILAVDENRVSSVRVTPLDGADPDAEDAVEFQAPTVETEEAGEAAALGNDASTEPDSNNDPKSTNTRPKPARNQPRKYSRTTSVDKHRRNRSKNEQETDQATRTRRQAGGR